MGKEMGKVIYAPDGLRTNDLLPGYEPFAADFPALNQTPT
jgi:hypothetical protein